MTIVVAYRPKTFFGSGARQNREEAITLLIAALRQMGQMTGSFAWQFVSRIPDKNSNIGYVRSKIDLSKVVIL